MTLPITSLTGMLALSEEASETQETINPVLPVGFEIFWSAVFFFTLLALMRYVLLPPIQQGREERAARLSAGRDSVSDSDSELAQILAAHKEQIAVAEAEGAAIIDAARAEADGQRAQAVGAVEEEITKLRSNAQAEIDVARSTALAGAKGSVSQLAVGAATKVLGRSVDLASNQSVIDSYLNSGS
ncbi:MAG: F0F1 ATP synthase subunit B [Acidimicrobiales bacterium]|jgi:F-type H+-transporting ATPase subunit b